MKLSVVTPSYNQASFLRATLESVHSQGYDNMEHWVIDGGSSDGSVAILEEYRQRGLLQYVSEPDKGQADAINKGFARCSGDIICWLNSDDLYAPGTLACVADFFRCNPEQHLLTGDCSFIDADGHPLWNFNARQVCRESLIRVTALNIQPSTFFRRQILAQVGGLNADLHYALDYDFWLRVTQTVPFAYLPRVFSWPRMHLQCKSMTANHETFLPEVVRCSRSHWGSPWTSAHWIRRFWVARHCSKVYYEAALAARQKENRGEFLHFLRRALLYAPWKLLYWRDLAASLRPSEEKGRVV